MQLSVDEHFIEQWAGPVVGREWIADATACAEMAERFMSPASDDDLARQLVIVAWSCWTEAMTGRCEVARRRFDRVLTVARATGQAFVINFLLSAQARANLMLGRLAEASAASEEAAELARLLGSGRQRAFALSQRCLTASWSGDDEAAIRLGCQAVTTAGDTAEWWGRVAEHAQAVALVNAGRLDEGAEILLVACDHYVRPKLDPGTLLSCCETMAAVEAARNRPDEALTWADRADQISYSDLKINTGLAELARAHALSRLDPAAAATHAIEAAGILAGTGRVIDAGRARLRAGTAAAEAGDRARSRVELRAAAEIFDSCGAKGPLAEALREQRRAGIRTRGGFGRRGRQGAGLSRRETEVAMLVVEGFTNQQIAARLFLSIRTVETHLSHIFTKLGVSSRVGVVGVLNQRTHCRTCECPDRA